jgi:hypothetical protein
VQRLTFTSLALIRYSQEHVQNSQVYISYGYKSNDRLLELYGFVEQDNPLEDYTVDNLFELFEDHHHAEQHAPLIEGDDVAGNMLCIVCVLCNTSYTLC